jgi:maltokinase
MADRLDVAAAEVPVLRPMLPRLHEILSAGGDDGPLQRVHGDLHLGQVLRSEGRWLLIDFEGEPAASIADRVAPASPWRDVASMLRSLDYANLPREARRAFLDGYTSVAGVTVPAAALRAHELDKAVYETVYETRNRPDWVAVPMAAVRRFHDAASGLPGDLPK